MFNELYDTLLDAPPEEMSPEVIKELKDIREDFTVQKFATIVSKFSDTPHLSPFAQQMLEIALGVLKSNEDKQRALFKSIRDTSATDS